MKNKKERRRSMRKKKKNNNMKNEDKYECIIKSRKIKQKQASKYLKNN